MTKPSLFRLPSADSAPAPWRAGADGGALEPGERRPAALKDPVLVAVPSRDLLLTRVSLALRGRRLRQAVPYALEDDLLRDVEDCHFALARAGGNETAVAVAAKARMQAWRARLADHGVAAAAMVPDALLLPPTPQGWTVMLEAGTVTVRTGALAGFACDRAVFEALLTGPYAPARIACLVDDEADSEALMMALQAAWPQAQISLAPLDDATALLAEQSTLRPPLDLLQGEYAASGNGAGRRQWRAVAALAGLWLLLGAVDAGYREWLLMQESQQLQRRIEAVYREAFPEARRVRYPRRQMEIALSQLQGRGGDAAFLRLLAEAAPVMAASAGFELRMLSYEDGRMELDFTVAAVRNAEAIKEAMAAKGLAVEVISVQASADDAVRVRLALSSPAPA